MAGVDENRLSNMIIGAAIEVHRVLGGPGLIEVLYQEALYKELLNRNIPVRREVEVPVLYKGEVLKHPLRLDIVVGDKVIVECKAVNGHHPYFESQALTYLRLTGLKLALVINFGAETIKEGVHRVVNGL